MPHGHFQYSTTDYRLVEKTIEKTYRPKALKKAPRRVVEITPLQAHTPKRKPTTSDIVAMTPKSARKILRAVRFPKSTRHAIKTAPKINAAFNIGSGKEIIFVLDPVNPVLERVLVHQTKPKHLVLKEK